MKKYYNEIRQEFRRIGNIVFKTYSNTIVTQFNGIQSILHKFQYNFHQLLFQLHRLFHLTAFMLCAVILLFLLHGCEKVIDVDLNESEPAIVIEGSLSFGKGDLVVKVSKTSSYFGNAPTEKVEDAEVYLENGPGFRLKAEETEKGIYTLTGLPKNTNSSYRLTVKADEELYSGVSELKALVKIDSINYEYLQEQIFFDGGYRISIYFEDPPDEENYYRVRVYKNGEPFNDADDIIVFDDSGFDGKGLRLRLRGQRFDEGDTAKAELLSIDKNAWEYFTTLDEMANLNPGSPSPANPISNLSNGALGYFSVWAMSSGEIVILEE